MKRALLALPLLALQLGCAGQSGCAGSACTRVLFIGNSYTYVNDLPTVFADLAASGGHQVETGMLANGGSTLANHVSDPSTEATLTGSQWNIVVLQEQSEIPSIPEVRERQMFPAAHQLVDMVRTAGAQPVFFVTWAHREGWPANGLPDYASMQVALDAGYGAVATMEHAQAVPVGDAWAAALQWPDVASLWQSDGSHPSLEGTYLSACVFYASLFHRSPVGLAAASGLPASEAATLQRVAALVVLTLPG
ncbi:MAG: hypothetical protein JOY80_04440 [Candidatus Dormibacteraeota bacterium]|nr:hypothetical protein [Candidatus Dormibacteraeota bacterium]